MTAGLVAERLRHAVATGEVGAERVVISASFGTASSAESDESLEAIIRRADETLYMAKRRGRNCVQMAAPPLVASALSSEPPPAAVV